MDQEFVKECLYLVPRFEELEKLNSSTIYKNPEAHHTCYFFKENSIEVLKIMVNYFNCPVPKKPTHIPQPIEKAILILISLQTLNFYNIEFFNKSYRINFS